MIKLFNDIIKVFNKYKVEILLTIAVIATICVFIYQQKEELFGGEKYADEDEDEDKDKDEDDDDKTDKKYIFIKKGTCANTKRANITDAEECQTAAKETGWTTFKFNNIADTFGTDRPMGCARHPFGNLDYFAAGKSKGEASANGYTGVYCKKRPNPKFKIWKFDKNDDLFAKNWPNIKDRNSDFKKERLKKWKTKVTKVGGTILKKVAKLKKLLDNTEDTKKIDLEKRIESREIRAAQLKKAYDQIEAVRKTL